MVANLLGMLLTVTIGAKLIHRACGPADSPFSAILGAFSILVGVVCFIGFCVGFYHVGELLL